MKEKISVPYVSEVDWSEEAYSTYETDYTVVESVIHYWSIAEGMIPHGERIRSSRRFIRHSGAIPDDTWLTTNDIPIGLNSGGTLIVANYDLDYLIANGCAMLSASEMHEIITHVAMAIDKCAEVAVWSPQAWHAFPRTERLDRIMVPF